MEKFIEPIVKIYEKYKNNEIMLTKISSYFNNDLNDIIDKNFKQFEIIINEKIDNFINSFIFNEDVTYFYNNHTNTFIVYDNSHYKTIKEDTLKTIIYREIYKNKDIYDYREKIKNDLIEKIKHNDIFHTIPESSTIQNMINYFTPIFFNTKEETKYFLSVLGDNILNKKNDLIYYISPHSKNFFMKILNLFKTTFEHGNRLTANFKFKNNETHILNNCRIIHFNPGISNTSCWDFFIQLYFLDFVCICCHYSNSFENSEKYINLNGNINTNVKNNILFFKNNSKGEMINLFINEMLIHDTNGIINQKDMYFLWKMFIKKNKIINVFNRTNFLNTLKQLENINYNEKTNLFMGLSNKHKDYLINFKNFWKNTITGEKDTYYELSELVILYKKWLKINNITICFIDENSIKDIISHYYVQNDINIDGKFVKNIQCNLWNKEADIQEYIDKHFNKYDNQSITFSKIYKNYCLYSRKHNILNIVSKQYFQDYLKKIVPNEYLINNIILPKYWRDKHNDLFKNV